MIRFRRVAQLWDWLPAFRGVAEHESLQRAASALGVSPSALSRTIKLLEDALGAPLFDRLPTGLRPTALGEELLAATRDAMRVVDDCLAAHEARAGRPGAVLVGATSELASMIVAATLPEPVSQPFELRRTTDDAVVDELLQGNLDVVATTSPPAAAAGLVVETTRPLRRGVYASARHALAARAGALAEADLAAARFVASDRALERADRVAVRTDSLETARLVCVRSDLLAVLPDAVAGAGGALVRLADAPEGPPLALLHRTPAAGRRDSPAIDAVVRALVTALA